jgi:bromodomain-containing factor 1
MMGKQFEELFDSQWIKKDEWIAEHSPAAASPERTPESEDEESEDEAPEQTTTASAARLRLIEEQGKLITLMSAKKPEPSLIQMQQDMVNIVQKLVNDEEAAMKTKKVKKPKAPKPAKKAAPVKKAAAPKKGGSQKARYMGTLEKETISAGLMSLPDDVSGTVLEMIKADQPAVDVSLLFPVVRSLANIY